MNVFPLRAHAVDDITSAREETKYVVPHEALEPIVRALSAELPPHRFTGERANRLPGAQHFVTTVYFDTPSRRHFRMAVEHADQSMKVRAKEYYDVHPSLVELATDASEILRYHPWLWFELKRHAGGRTEKRRFRLPKRDVPAFFAGESLAADPPPASDPAPEAGPGSGLDEVEAYVRGIGEPLAATCLVNYRRLSWQATDGSLRVTIDLGLACYAPPDDLWQREQPLERSLLGPPVRVLADAVVEVKRRGPLPAWLAAALDVSGVTSVEFSKFVTAMRAVGADGPA